MAESSYVEQGKKLALEGKYLEAAVLFEQAAEKNPEDVQPYWLLGVALAEAGELEKAVAALFRATSLKPDFWEAYFYLGLCLKGMGRLDGAEACLRKVLTLQPNHAESYNNLGLILNEAGQLLEAESCFLVALELTPDSAELCNNYGVLKFKSHLLAEAVHWFRKAIDLQPEYVQACNNLGLALKDSDKPEEACEWFRRALEIQPNYGEAHNNLGLVLKDLQELTKAEVHFRKAIELRREHEGAYNNLFLLLKDAGRLEEAEACLRQGIAVKPEHALFYYHLGNFVQDLGRLEEAIAAHEKALALQPEYQEAAYALGLIYFSLGQYERAWEKYELRWPLFGNFQPPIPLWQGEDLTGKKILLFREQGYGDIIQFSRYAPMVAAMAKETILWVDTPVESLMTNSFAMRVVGGNRVPDGEYDVACALMSLPYWFHTKEETIPAQVPYLYASKERSTAWRDRLAHATEGKKLRVGVVWAGNPKHKNDANRSVAIQAFQELFALQDIAWVSLQAGTRAQEVQQTVSPVWDVSAELTDFTETAALITNLDLVLAADTAVAHLAGAMGKETWVLIPHIAEWRWQLKREDTPWYPTMRLFRQQQPGDWLEVLGRVKAELLKKL
nr:tetratricopeptide repeat protein [uncultured Anaeromusa sp.]